jgi:hypothetical protein
MTTADRCRILGHQFANDTAPRDYSDEAPSVFAEAAAAYFAALTEPVTAICQRCGVERTDYPDGRRTYTTTIR